MKKTKFLLLISCSLLLMQYTRGQYIFDEYKVLSDTSKTFKMAYFVDKKEIYINAFSNDFGQDQSIGFIIQEKHLPNFIDDMRAVKNKYIEWKKIAIAQDVEKIEKELPLSIVANIFFKDIDGKISVIEDVKLKFIFQVNPIKAVKDYKTICIKMYSGKIKLTEFVEKDGKRYNKWVAENQVIPISKGLKIFSMISDASKTSTVIQDLNGFFIAFFEDTEIDNFISKISLERLNEVKKIKSKDDDKKKLEKAKESLFH